ncbi:hypothetical protein GCM10009549_01730 [Streptomyces thermoalcalitolerans]|uniref:Uncharacterized protein n=1 Tax=Streptomyces thermoalcalitolerans TaxID=65605 RepID=A0ABN1NBM1_9ACTN
MGGESTAAAERRAVEAESPSVIDRLRRCASRAGGVSWRAFSQEADRLGLTTDEQRQKLRDGLAELGKGRPPVSLMTGRRGVIGPCRPQSVSGGRSSARRAASERLGFCPDQAFRIQGV